ncbi:MAG: hypothetical protein AAF304_08785, partial [Pseudomonadota bacterium]
PGTRSSTWPPTATRTRTSGRDPGQTSGPRTASTRWATGAWSLRKKRHMTNYLYLDNRSYTPFFTSTSAEFSIIELR